MRKRTRTPVTTRGSMLDPALLPAARPSATSPLGGLEVYPLSPPQGPGLRHEAIEAGRRSLARASARRTAVEMGEADTVTTGGGSRSAAAATSKQAGDGMADAYTQIRVGRAVDVQGYCVER